MNEEIRGILMRLEEAVAAGEDPSRWLEQLRAVLQRQYPGQDAEIEALIMQLVEGMLPSLFDNGVREVFGITDPANTTRSGNIVDGTKMTLWYGTDRQPKESQKPERGYGGRADTTVHYGTCTVWIPESHHFGEVGSPWWQRLYKGDDRLQVESINPLTENVFWNSVQKAITAAPEGEKQALIYLHGYNTDFNEAAVRAAQIGCDLKVPGMTAFFSWPSKGTFLGYPADEAAVDRSVGAVRAFLQGFVSRSGAEKVHLIAHSMGSRALNAAIEDIQATPNVRFGQVIIAAADLDAIRFQQVVDAYHQLSERTTLYVSPADIAVWASRFLHAAPRIGYTPPVAVTPGVDTVFVPKPQHLLDLGHGYYAEHTQVLNDIHLLLHYNTEPGDRVGLKSAVSETGPYWRIPE